MEVMFERSLDKVIFAKWVHDGYYYPALIAENQVAPEIEIRVAYLDGDVGMVSKSQIVEQDKAFEAMAFEANWKNHGAFYKGAITSRNPLIINYDDGTVEHIDLKQLRGAMPGEDTIFTSALSQYKGCLYAVVIVVAIIAFIILLRTGVIAAAFDWLGWF